MAKEAGAKKVYFASAAPQVRFSHCYGIDLAPPSDLIAFKRTDEEIAEHIGAEAIIFQALDNLIDACRSAAASPQKDDRSEQQQFEVGVFNGEYVTPIPEGYFAHLERIRGESKKMKVIESAREAVAKGSADPQDVQIATNGAEVTNDGMVVPSSSLRADQTPMTQVDQSSD